MRKLNMRFLATSMVALTLLTVPVAATEVRTEVPQEKITAASDSKLENVRGQVFKWYYRRYNGKLQKRLWSLTEEKWITGWIDCE
ncbi:MAG: hypothetical protein E7294_08745 [Lachnospiraceae bacterium]|nr:hypothetical protein [Lachnospiraceae bacterium]